ncbi:LysR family transcriptional regulator [Rhizobium sp. WYJ-E13]|uniref:LysR family transcriptional regulator n=1 Tax=Rhizobium sp. WYJ-E13 TaxID=2849093 RepID=UPI001C1EE591|nr:LysR family transcriptional regulator [Rhizobium sp. WYJ-E13]QWW72426.1 LysR family transcriptional regulator [Rhizobium sp. WYJ-E13]
MDWDDLRVFLCIARTGQITEASKLLGLDHSTISRRLARLESGLAVKLFNRAGRRLKITSAGENLVAVVTHMESTLLSEIGSVAGDREEISGTVRIGAPEGLGAAYLSAHLNELRAEYASLDIELVALPQNYSLASREVDIAITLDRPGTGSIATRRLTDYELGFFASDSYIRIHGEPSALQDIDAHILCGYIPSLLHTRELDYLDALGFKQRPALRSTSIIAQRHIVETGQAIGILPFFMVPEDAGLKPLLEDFRLTRSYWLSVHEDLRHIRRVRVTVDALGALFQRHQSLFRRLPAQAAVTS